MYMVQINSENISVFTIQKTASSPLLPEALSYTGLRICIVLQGNALWEINGQLYPVEPGTVVLLSHQQKRRFVRYGDGGLTLGVLAIDRQAFVHTNHYAFFLSCVRDADGVLHNEQLWSILSEAYREALQLQSGSMDLISAKLTEFFVKAQRICGFRPETVSQPEQNMLKILDYVDSRMTGKLSLSDAAGLVGLTESTFSRWFSKQNGISFKKYVMARRIEYAVRLLDTTDRKVIDVAYECGFDSISGFYDTFRKITGTTPGKYSGIV